MFSVEEYATILNALRFYYHNNPQCAEEAALCEKIIAMLKLAETDKSPPEQSPQSTLKWATLKK